MCLSWFQHADQASIHLYFQSDQDVDTSSKRAAVKPLSGHKQNKSGRSYRPQRTGLFSYADLIAKRSEEEDEVDQDEVREEALLQKRLRGPRSSSTTLDLVNYFIALLSTRSEYLPFEYQKHFVVSEL